MPLPPSLTPEQRQAARKDRERRDAKASEALRTSLARPKVADQIVDGLIGNVVDDAFLTPEEIRNRRFVHLQKPKAPEHEEDIWHDRATPEETAELEAWLEDEDE
jgi:hypothetical protein